MSFSIRGATALVTGANRGIGQAIAEALATGGARRIYATARSIDALQPLVKAFPKLVTPLELDIGRPDQISAAAASAGDLTLLINNAGVAGSKGLPFQDPQWLAASDAEYAVNVRGTLAVTQAFAPVLARNGGGAVVNIVSIVAMVNFPLFLAYSASKAALHSITQGTRASLAGQATQVIGVYPGPVDTRMSEGVPLDKATPAEVAAAILQGLAAGDEEIFPDAMSRQLGAVYQASPKGLERQFAPQAA